MTWDQPYPADAVKVVRNRLARMGLIDPEKTAENVVHALHDAGFDVHTTAHDKAERDS